MKLLHFLSIYLYILSYLSLLIGLVRSQIKVNAQSKHAIYCVAIKVGYILTSRVKLVSNVFLPGIFSTYDGIYILS
jgi:hypothetical protein